MRDGLFRPILLFIVRIRYRDSRPQRQTKTVNTGQAEIASIFTPDFSLSPFQKVDINPLTEPIIT